ncbi:MAG: hypothetical protein ACMZI0_15645 [Symbiopectobacterium sp.]|uniref:hypothetical protein n=1 Tax=Symbiopectobacterium sp. TaxID=2952789 RepID=UPI0039EB7421
MDTYRHQHQNKGGATLALDSALFDQLAHPLTVEQFAQRQQRVPEQASALLALLWSMKLLTRNAAGYPIRLHPRCNLICAKPASVLLAIAGVSVINRYAKLGSS